MPKNKGDKTPNQLFNGIEIVPGFPTKYTETGAQYDIPEGFEEHAQKAEDLLIARLKAAVESTKGTDHNAVFRIAGLLNYVAKHSYQHVFVKESEATTTYHLLLEGGYLAWEEVK